MHYLGQVNPGEKHWSIMGMKLYIFFIPLFSPIGISSALFSIIHSTFIEVPFNDSTKRQFWKDKSMRKRGHY